MSNSYWQQRERDALYNRRLGVAENNLAKEYVKCLHRIQSKMESLYDEIIISSADGTLLISDLYKFNRYYDLVNEISNHLTTLGEKENKIMSNSLTDMYLTNSQLITDELRMTIPINDNAVKTAINTIWCEDGKHWSQRIWVNKALLEERVKKGLIDCVARGASKDEMVKDLMANMNVGFNMADRLARTELNFIQNRSTYDKYAEAGIKEYEFLAEIDGRTSEICKEHNGNIYRLEDAQVGVNYPPLHPNCRSTVVAVLDKEVK